MGIFDRDLAVITPCAATPQSQIDSYQLMQRSICNELSVSCDRTRSSWTTVQLIVHNPQLTVRSHRTQITITSRTLDWFVSTEKICALTRSEIGVGTWILGGGTFHAFSSTKSFCETSRRSRMDGNMRCMRNFFPACSRSNANKQ